jgi:hypothetical protein
MQSFYPQALSLTPALQERMKNFLPRKGITSTLPAKPRKRKPSEALAWPLPAIVVITGVRRHPPPPPPHSPPYPPSKSCESSQNVLFCFYATSAGYL